MGFAATRTRPARIAIPVLLALLAGSIALALAAPSADGSKAKVLGPGKSPKPACPTTDEQACLVVNEVTGFQTISNGKRHVFEVPQNGSIVAWSVDLSKPSKGEKATFNGLFDGPAAAQLAILKKKNNKRFRLTKHSHTVSLSPYYGEEPIFTLRNPLRVKKGLIVAITTTTWLPSIAYGGNLSSSDDKWRASRKKDKCEKRKDLLESTPHRKKGSVRTYGCTYDTARLLYKAYLAPDSN